MAGRIDAKLAELGIIAAKTDGTHRQLRPLRRQRQPGRDLRPAPHHRRQGRRKPASSAASSRSNRVRRRRGIRFINVLVHLKTACGGDLDRVRRVVRLGGFIACTPEFSQQAQVMNGASDLAVAVFGEARPARAHHHRRGGTAARRLGRGRRDVRDPLMPDGSAALTLTLHPRIADIAAADWDACAGNRQSLRQPRLPLARSKTAARPARAPAGCRSTRRCATRPARWSRWRRCTPSRTATANTCSTTAGRTPSTAPAATTIPNCRSRSRSARSPARACCCRPGAGISAAALAGALEQACRELNLSSVHVTFCPEAEWTALGEAGWLQRLGMQFHWENDGYASFEDFLAALSSRKRKVLRRERRDANAAGLTFLALTGADLTEARMGRVLPLLHLDRGPQMGQRLSDAPLLFAAGRAPGRQGRADDGRA